MQLSNPPAHSYEWKQISSGDRYQGRVWPIRVDSTMSGDFECRATNELGEGTATLKLVVQHTPKITVPASINPNEMEDVDIQCEVNAVPEAIDIKWIGPNGFKKNGSRLTLPSVSKAQSGNYTCVATNFLTVYGLSGSQQRVGTGTTLLDVRRKPGQAQIVSTRQSVDVGETIKLVCQAEDVGNPSSTYAWASPSSGGIFGLEGHNDKSFEVRNAQLSDNGVYSCKAYNDLGEGKPATVMITVCLIQELMHVIIDVFKVIEQAQISSPLATEKIFTAGEQGKVLECEAQGYPTPVVSWLKDGVPVKQKFYETSQTVESKCNPEDYCTQTVASTLTLFGPLKWWNKGNFTCIAENGSNKKNKDSSSWTVVRVLHKPVILNTKFPKKSLAAADIGSQAILKCTVSARPEPEFHWMFKDSEIFENERYSFHTVGTSSKPDQYEQVLQIESVQDSDYGDYICRATNGNGADHVIIELRKTSKPALPVDLQKLAATSNSILLGWIPQFDGGSNQSYVLEARKIDPFSGEIDENLPATKLRINSDQQEQEIDGDLVSKSTYNFTGLTPLSTYYLRIQAVNEKGESDFTTVLIASTEDVMEDASMMSPSRLVLDSGEQKIDVEPKLPSDACTLLYVLADGIWRTSICYTSSNPIGNIVPGREYKARFCTTTDGFKCSPVSKTICMFFEHLSGNFTRIIRYFSASGSGSVWKTKVFIPFVFFIFIGMAVCVFFLVCCKTRTATKSSKLSPIILTSLPGDELKKPSGYEEPNHATFAVTSENDNEPLSHHESFHNCSKPGTNMEYDVSTDCYLQDNVKVLKNTSLSGFGNIESSENGDSNEDRRIVREIIV
ncbi:hypothetical protein CAEBREN_31749 [Caenorhabditis brenneri]|uniref:Uncharacterized protein n=1 Tax=Caenorhabditis brenneri TaxID=135651 RepID=G0N7L5_CAEBE|nr:hypothetical protein CAEBREN_31749 [Caenorhabditis brenneri]